MTTVVFSGPSTWNFAPAVFEGIERRGPARAGDVLLALADGMTIIGIIDGVFRSTLAVQHKEILYALSRGVKVFGASSIGALRAAECARFGMVGIGSIYEQYARGERSGDADICLEHAPAELHYKPLTVPLVDIEATVEAASRNSVKTAAALDALLGTARQLHYSLRTWDRIFADTDLGSCAAEVREAIEASRRSQKEDDAGLLLAALSIVPAKTARPTGQAFARTAFFDALERRTPRRKGEFQ